MAGQYQNIFQNSELGARVPFLGSSDLLVGKRSFFVRDEGLPVSTTLSCGIHQKLCMTGFV